MVVHAKTAQVLVYFLNHLFTRLVILSSHDQSGESRDALSSQLIYFMHHGDDPAESNDNLSNDGKKVPCKYFQRQQYVPLFRRISSDLFYQSKPFITGIPLNIRLLMSRPEIYLRVGDTDRTTSFTASIKNPGLVICRYMPSPDYVLSVSQQLLTSSIM